MRRACLVAPLLLALACQERPTAERPPSPPSTASAVLAVRTPSGAAGPFRLAELDRLAIDVNYASQDFTPGERPIRIDVFSPRGALYAQLQSTLLVTSNGAGAVSQSLEVRGTPIDTFNQVGTWKFVVAVDGGEPLASAEVDLTE